MSEHIDNQDLLSSGGHRWLWETAPVSEKVLGTVGLRGNWSMAMGSGGVSGRIEGQLRVTAGSVGACTAALKALEAAIEALAASGSENAWEDDLGRSGTRLVVRGYLRAGPAQVYDGGLTMWQQYVIPIRENSGRITA